MNTEPRRFLAFVITGGLAALVNIAARAVFSQVMAFEIAILAAYLVAMITAYVLSRLFVFDASGRSVAEEFTKFALVNLVALVQVWLVAMGLRVFVLPWLGWTLYPDLTAHILGVASPILTSYFGHKYFSFRPAQKSSGGDAT